MGEKPWPYLWAYTKIFLISSCTASILIPLYSSKIDLQQRIEYLSRAVMSVKSASFRSEKTDADFVHELEERLDVCRVSTVLLISSILFMQQRCGSWRFFHCYNFINI